MKVQQPDEWSSPLSKIFDSQINSLVEDMNRFIDEHPEWYPDGKIPSEPHTSPSDSLELQRCGMYPKCTNYITDKAWERYGVCSSRCDERAEAEIDGVQQNGS